MSDTALGAWVLSAKSLLWWGLSFLWWRRQSSKQINNVIGHSDKYYEGWHDREWLGSLGGLPWRADIWARMRISCGNQSHENLMCGEGGKAIWATKTAGAKALRWGPAWLLQWYIQKKEVQKVTDICRDQILLGFVDDGKRFVFYLHYHGKHQRVMAQYDLPTFKR